MAAQLEKMQRDLIQITLLETIRDEKLAVINHGLAVAAQRQALNEKEWAEVTAEVNKLLVGRDAWLKQMREASMRRQRLAQLTIAEEELLNQQVDVLLRDLAQRNSVANVKYESDNVPDTAPKNATGFEAGLEGMLSKITGALGDGPFAFIGKLLQQIFSFIFPLISAFKEMGKKTVSDLIKEGSFDEADAELTLKENELINKLRSFDVKSHAEIKTALDAYEAELEKLKECPLDGGKSIPFAETNEAYKRNILASRIKMLDQISSTVAPALATHEELIATQRREALGQQKLTQLGLQKVAVNDGHHALELGVLNARIAALNVNIADLKQKREAAKAEEDRFIAQDMPRTTAHIGDLSRQNGVLFSAEQKRQKTLAKKAAHDVGKARIHEREETAHRRQVELAQAQRPAPVVAPHA